MYVSLHVHVKKRNGKNPDVYVIAEKITPQWYFEGTWLCQSGEMLTNYVLLKTITEPKGVNPVQIRSTFLQVRNSWKE